MLFLVLKILVIASLARLFLATQSIFLCSGLYTAFVGIRTLAGTGSFTMGLLEAGIVFAASSFYYWVLSKLDETEITWWLWLVAAGVALTFL